MEELSPIKVVVRTGTSTRAPISPPQYYYSYFESEPVYRPLEHFIQELLSSSLYRDGDIRRNDSINLNIPKVICSEDKTEICSICQSNFKKNENLSFIRTCNHRFHYDCLIEWGKYKQSCPICRADIEYF